MNDLPFSQRHFQRRWLALLLVLGLCGISPAGSARAAHTNSSFSAPGSIGSVLDVQNQLNVYRPNMTPKRKTVRSTTPTTWLYDRSKFTINDGEKGTIEFCNNGGLEFPGYTAATLHGRAGSTCTLSPDLHRRSIDRSLRPLASTNKTGVLTSLDTGELYSVVPGGAGDEVQTDAAVATSMPVGVSFTAAPTATSPGAAATTSTYAVATASIYDVKVTGRKPNKVTTFTVVQGVVRIHNNHGFVDLGVGDQDALTSADTPKVTNHLDSNELSALTAWTHGLKAPGYLVGRWVNADPTATGIAELDIQKTGYRATIRAFGVCSPNPCDWGVVDATAYSASTDAAQTIAVSATYTASFKQTILTGRLEGDTLTVTEYTKFMDGSGRSDYFLVERFHRPGAASAGGSSRQARSTPATRRVKPRALEQAPTLSHLLGDWKNGDGASKGLVDVSLSDDNGELVVHASASPSCSQTPCDWGSAKGTAYATSTSSTDGVAFTTLYDLGFAETLLTGMLDGGSLVTTSYTRFKDGSDRSNYVDTETFHQVPTCGQQVGQHCAAIWTDQSQYHVYDVMVIRYSVPGPAHVRILYFRSDGSMQVVLDDTNDGSGGSVTALVLPQPAGRARLQLDVYSLTDGSLITSVGATLDLVSSPVLRRE